MPTSQYNQIGSIMKLILFLNPKSILDIGTGFGKYGVLCRECLELYVSKYQLKEDYHSWERKIDGIEIYEEYLTPLHKFVYDEIFIGDAIDILPKIQKYDLILLIDVLEHFDEDEGKLLIKEMKNRTDHIIISTPKNPGEQRNSFGNVHETHRSRWSKRGLKKLGPTFFVPDSTSHILLISNKEQLKGLKLKFLKNYVKSIANITHWLIFS